MFIAGCFECKVMALFAFILVPCKPCFNLVCQWAQSLPEKSKLARVPVRLASRRRFHLLSGAHYKQDEVINSGFCPVFLIVADRKRGKWLGRLRNAVSTISVLMLSSADVTLSLHITWLTVCHPRNSSVGCVTNCVFMKCILLLHSCTG